MTLPNMKIWTGGDREYSERARAAIREHSMTLFYETEFVYWCERPEQTPNNNFPVYRLAANGNLVPAEADDDGWILWHGGECPVDDTKKGPSVDVERRDGIVMSEESGYVIPPWRWRHISDGSDIVRYRVPSQILPTSQKLEQETDMSETLTAAEALREVVQGHENGDDNPWERVQWQDSGSNWHAVGGPRSFGMVLSVGDPLRRKPRAVRIEGEISEEAIKELRFLSAGYIGPNAESIAGEMLSLVQDQ